MMMVKVGGKDNSGQSVKEETSTKWSNLMMEQ